MKDLQDVGHVIIGIGEDAAVHVGGGEIRSEVVRGSSVRNGR